MKLQFARYSKISSLKEKVISFQLPTIRQYELDKWVFNIQWRPVNKDFSSKKI